MYCVKPIQAKSLKAQILSFVQQLQPLKVLSNEFSTNISAVPGASLPLLLQTLQIHLRKVWSLGHYGRRHSKVGRSTLIALTAPFHSHSNWF